MVKIAISLFLALLSCYLCKADIPWNQPQKGDFTYYNDKGFGACGTQIDASSQQLVAISHDWFTNPNPNNDPFCTSGVCVEVSYNGKSLKLPVKDKCAACDKPHIDLSQPAFAQLAPLSVGHVYGITWKFVHC